MKRTILIIMFILIPSAMAIYGGETWTYHFDYCDALEVNITGTSDIIDGEYTIHNNCTENQTNYWICDCYDGYDFNISFKINAVNNYLFSFNYNYSKYVSDNGGGGGGGGGGSSTPTKPVVTICTPNWQCTEWSNCQPNGKSTRTCTVDLNNCSTEKPSEKRICYYYVASEEPKEVVLVGNTTEEIEKAIKEGEIIEEKEPEDDKDKELVSGINLLVVLVLTIIVVGTGIRMYKLWKEFINTRKSKEKKDYKR